MIRVPHGAPGATHAILRIAAGLLFMCHGAQKLFGWFGGMPPDGGTAPLFSQIGLAGLLEVLGGALIVVGFFTHVTALVLVLEMLVAYFQVHFPSGFWPIENRGELALLYALTFLFLAANGAGPFSVDAARRITQRWRGEEAEAERETTEEIDVVTAEYQLPSIKRPLGRGPSRTRDR